MKDFDSIYIQYKDMVFRYINSRIRNTELAEEITTDVFLKVYEWLKVFDPEKGRFSTWLLTITRNTMILAIRVEKSKAKNFATVDDIKIYNDNIAIVDNTLDREEMREIFKKALKALKPIDQEIVDMYFVESLTYKDISELLNISVSAVKVHVFRVRAKLHKYLEHSLTN